MHSGKFICIDGANGSGKSSIVTELAKLLNEDGLDFIMTKEPTSSKLGQFIRTEQDNFEGITLACLVTADRYNHIENVIKPNLEKGKIVITDRYLPSSLVYQVIDGLEFNYIWELNKHIIFPDLFIHILASPKTIAIRLSSRDKTTRFENLSSLNKELALYQDTFRLLSTKGFDVLTIENDERSIIENGIIVYKAILNLYDKQ